MTPETLALARAICGMEGAIPFADMGRYLRVDDDRLVGEAGVVWALDPEQRRWILDLDAPATGGALLPYVGSGWVIYQRDHDGVWEISRPDGEDRSKGETLGIALAKVIAVRGWKP